MFKYNRDIKSAGQEKEKQDSQCYKTLSNLRRVEYRLMSDLGYESENIRRSSGSHGHKSFEEGSRTVPL